MRVLITGTTNGIGKCILEYLCTTEFEIYTINRKESYFSNIKKNYVCDLTNVDEVIKLINQIKHLNIDILINNAGGGLAATIADLEINKILEETTLNFITPLLLIKEFYPQMINKEYARIINISSISAKRGTPFLYVYSAAKAALDSITQSVASTSVNKGFSINSICPGGINTEMSVGGRKILSNLNGLNEIQYQREMISSMKLENLIEPSELNALIEFLLNPKSNYINGQSINFCGTLEVK